MQHQSKNPGLGSSADAFGHTRWSLVAALRADSSGSGNDPLTELSHNYWYPVYAFLRSSQLEPEAAQHGCRRFFAHLADAIRSGNPAESGRFRVYLLDQLQSFVEAPPAPPPLTLPEPPQAVAELEQRLLDEHGLALTPESIFERSFGLQVISRSRDRLRVEAEKSGRTLMFERLAPYLTVEPNPQRVHELTQELGIGKLAIQVAVRRLRQRFRDLVEAELAETVSSSGDLEAERAALLRVLAQTP